MLNLRMSSQAISSSRFSKPEEVVEWMGAMQAQEIRAAKWAVGLRLGKPSLSAVREALDAGRILRIHVMRPTWHYIPGKDIKWMTELSVKNLLSRWYPYARQHGLTEEDYRRYKPHLERVLGGQQLTYQEAVEQLNANGLPINETATKLCLSLAEAEGMVCSGAERNGKHTYTLTCERIKDAVDLSREEALAELTRRYFRSHGPATLEDFVWWSALGVREARAAIASLGQEIITERYNGREMMTHISSPGLAAKADIDEKSIFRLLPPFDEYLVSYKNRLDCIKEAHTQYAYNTFGIFQPVILHNGRITGNWRKAAKKEAFGTSFFPGCRPAAKKLIEKAIKEFLLFHES